MRYPKAVDRISYRGSFRIFLVCLSLSLVLDFHVGSVNGLDVRINQRVGREITRVLCLKEENKVMKLNFRNQKPNRRQLAVLKFE